MMTSTQSREDILLWPDGTWCYREELHEMSHMSDDFTIISVGSPEHTYFLEDPHPTNSN